MKKLLLTPFLLASLFSPGGELKANPGSRYELPDPRSSLSESQSNSKNVWYLLNQSVIQQKGGWSVKQWIPVSFEKLKIARVSNRTICERLASQEKEWIQQIDLGSDIGSDYKYKAYTKCIKVRNENEANYVLKIAAINMRTMDLDGKYYEFIDVDDQVEFSSFDTLYFKDLSKCNLAKSQLDNWFTTLENKFLNNSLSSKIILRYSTKCFSKN